MDPSPEEITAMADQLTQLAKSVAASTDLKEAANSKSRHTSKADDRPDTGSL
jgi:hypothetical protein